jgi:hypothetical protein
VRCVANGCREQVPAAAAKQPQVNDNCPKEQK